MGLLCDYFLAPSDDAAAATIDRVGGPGRGAPPQPEPRRGLFRRRPAAVPSATDVPRYLVVDGGGIEPVVNLGQLEALLTGRTLDAVLDANLAGDPVALRNGGELLVLKVSDALTTALADASTQVLAEVAEPWSRTEELVGRADPRALAAFLDELAELARRGRDRHEAVYCWLSV